MDFNSTTTERYRKSVLMTGLLEGQDCGRSEEKIDFGETLYSSGVSLENDYTAHRIRSKGLYRSEASLIFTPCEDGDLTIQMYLDDKTLPASIRTYSVEFGKTYTFTTAAPAISCPTTADPCCELFVTSSGVAGRYSTVTLTTTKLA